MRVRTGFVGAIALSTMLVLTGCGDDGDSGGDAASPSRSTGTITEEQVRAAVLQVSDLPSGWSVEPPEEDTEDDLVLSPQNCNDQFQKLTEDGDDPVHEAETTFSRGGELGTQLTTSVEAHTSTLEESQIADMRAFLANCGSMTTVIEDMKFDVTMGETSFAELGDKTFALRMTMSNDMGLEFTADLIVVAVGNTGIFISTVGLQPVETTELEDIATAGITRLEDAIAGRVTAPPSTSAPASTAPKV